MMLIILKLNLFSLMNTNKFRHGPKTFKIFKIFTRGNFAVLPNSQNFHFFLLKVFKFYLFLVDL